MSQNDGIAGQLLLAGAYLMLLMYPNRLHAQAGPPFLSNDAGTPGNGNWEINLATSPSVTRLSTSIQAPQIDLNFGVGDRVQLTYEVPFVIASAPDAIGHTGWGNAFAGIKWRFLDQGEDGWQASIFPQIETGGSTRAQDNGIASPGPRYLLPLEVTHKLGPVNIDFEVGQYVPGHGQQEHILGLVAGRSVSSRLELDVEIYDDRAKDSLPHETIADIGGRFTIHPGVIALFMAGRSISGNGDSNTRFVGYFGLQILLSHYGLALNTSEP